MISKQREGAARIGMVARLILKNAEEPGEGNPIVIVVPRLLSLGEAARYCGISATHFDKHCSIRPIRIGARRLWDVHALDAWIDVLAGGARGQEDFEEDATDRAIRRLSEHHRKTTKGRKAKRRKPTPD